MESWCEEMEPPLSLRQMLLEQDHLLEDGLQGFWETCHEKVLKSADLVAEAAAVELLLRDEVGSVLENQIAEERRNGDPDKRLPRMQAVLAWVNSPKPLPEIWGTPAKPVKRGRKRSFTVAGRKHSVKTQAWGGHEYALVPGGGSWQTASEWCRATGGYLVCIESREELEFIGRHLLNPEEEGYPRLDTIPPHRYNYWVGASDSRQEGTWQWGSGRKVEKNLFHINGIPPQPSNFNWGENHAGLVRFLHPDRGRSEVGMVSWHGPSRSQGICEWGRATLPAPWDVLADKALGKTLAPYWEQHGDSQLKIAEALAKVQNSGTVRKAAKEYGRLVSATRDDFQEDISKQRRALIRQGDDRGAALLEDLSQGLDLGAFCAEPAPLAPVPRESGRRLLGRAFGRSYYASTTALTWVDAEQACRAWGASLPFPRSRLELELLAHMLRRPGAPDATWLAVATHPNGARSGWRSPHGPWSTSAPNWLRALLSDAADGRGGLYAFGLVLPTSWSPSGGGRELQLPDQSTSDGPKFWARSTEIRTRFLYVVEGEPRP